jgi:ABC-type antimicrobial peptide transport system permease subunit
MAPGGVREIHTLHELAAWRVYPFRVAYWIAGAVGLLALILTVSGVYGVLSYLVMQREKEIGIRVALGAGVVSLVSLVLWQSLRFAAIGLLLGGGLAVVTGRLVASQMRMIDPTDLVPFAGGAMIVTCASVCAAGFPALRAARIDPLTTLRAE